MVIGCDHFDLKLMANSTGLVGLIGVGRSSHYRLVPFRIDRQIIPRQMTGQAVDSVR